MSNDKTLHVTVFGASGNIGRHVGNQLLDSGHVVTAYVRNPVQADRYTPQPHGR